MKNSWGKQWGMDGYIHVERNNGNAEGVCGINMLASYPTKTGQNPPPPPSPGPTRCSLFTRCGEGETCCCGWRILGICLSWKCCGLSSAVCCKDNLHCCPHDYPICDTARSQCFKVCLFTFYFHVRLSFMARVNLYSGFCRTCGTISSMFHSRKISS